MKKLGYLAGASLLFVPMPLYAAGIGSSNQVFTHKCINNGKTFDSYS